MSKNRRVLLLALVLIQSFSSRAQSKIVSGKVTDANNQPLAKVSIVVKNHPNAAAVSDDKGLFSIAAASGDVLVFTMVGYQASEVKVGRQTNLSVSLTQTAANLSDVIIVGYGTSSRQNITTAVAKIDPKTVPQAANSSVGELLFGRAPGLNVQQSSTQPGGLINLSIRGQGAPLIVVDGVIFPNDALDPTGGQVEPGTNGVSRGALQNLNPSDIESIEVLKDASASIYGVNAANGVILITTKKGRSGAMNVTLNASHSFINNNAYLKPLNATQYETLFDTFQQDQYLGTHNMAPYGANPPSGLPTPKYSAAQISAAGAGTNWLDQIFQKGYIDNDNLSISGGSEKVTYFFSGGFFNQQGTLKGSAMTKYTGRSNLSFNLAKWVTLNTNVTGSNNAYQNSSSGGQFDGSGPQGFGIIQAALGFPANVPVYTNGALSTFSIISNPVGLLKVQDNTSYHSLDANISADFKILPSGLTGKLLFGDNYEHAVRDFFVPSSIFFYQQYLSRASLNYNDRENQTLEASLNYKKQFGDWLNMDLVAGAGQYISKFSSFTSGGTGAQDGLGTTDLAAETGNIAIASNKTVNTTHSYFGRGTFGFLDRYLLTASLRDDGYSLFYPGNKFALFPAVSVGWKINNESFLKKADAINLLKLRASIGVTGQTIGSAAYGGYAPNGDNVYLGGQEYVTISQYAMDNPNLTWQKTINKNLGLDFGFLGNRINGTVDVFRNDITNLLSTSAPTPPLAPLFTQTVNGAHQVRTGYEFSINTRNFVRRDFEWSTVLNVSHYYYRWQDRFPFAVLQAYQSRTDAVDERYYFKTKGLLKPGDKVPASQPTTGGASLPGSPVFVDRNGDGKLDANDVYKLNADPKIGLGFGNTFRYKQLDLSLFFYGQFGGHGTNYNYAWGDPVSILSASQNGTTGAFNVYSSSNAKGNRPSVNYVESAVGLLVGSDLNLVSTDFVRLRNLELGYRFTGRSVSKIFRSLRLYVDAQNLFIITKFQGGDPEVTYQSVKGGYAPYPTARTISIGLTAGF